MSEAEYVSCLDPGKKTGWALLELPPDKPAICIARTEVDGTPAGIGSLRLWAKDLWVVETWEYRHGTPTDARQACEPLGIVKYLAWEQGVPVLEQRPGFRNSIPDTRAELEPLGWWIAGQKGNKPSAINPEGFEGHARQALRHGLAWAVHTRKHRPTIDHLRSLV